MIPKTEKRQRARKHARPRDYGHRITIFLNDKDYELLNAVDKLHSRVHRRKLNRSALFQQALEKKAEELLEA